MNQNDLKYFQNIHFFKINNQSFYYQLQTQNLKEQLWIMIQEFEEVTSAKANLANYFFGYHQKQILPP